MGWPTTLPPLYPPNASNEGTGDAYRSGRVDDPADHDGSDRCGLSEYAEKAIEVPTSPSATYGVGDEVNVVLKATMGLKAVWLAYFLPLVVLLGVALGLIALGVGEVAAGLAGLGAVALYYGVLWLLRDRLRNEYIFTIQ